MKIAIISLGCPKNQVDADVFCHALIKDGHTTVADPAEADIIIINTCGFIESAKAEAIENILMACQYKQQNPDLKVWPSAISSRSCRKSPRSTPLSALAPTPRCLPSCAAFALPVRARSRATAPRPICSWAVPVLSPPRATMRT